MESAGTAKARVTSQGQHETPAGHASAEEPAVRRVYYGLPCANCGTYYASDVSVCPTCKCSERVSPTAISVLSNCKAPELDTELDELEQERERFLREFKAQLYAAHTQINTGASLRCVVEQNHRGSNEAAAVCQPCYDRVQERADRMEAALHMDLKEAAQIVYDAVWADSSDPGKTYANAAQALLTELRKRAGMSTVLSTLQPYAN